jgi:NodT family efflux transporter outer membrane factor (OMF) lipoprotein
VSFDEHWVETAQTGPVDATWWRSLNDPLLSELVDQAVAGNLDLARAEARLREARANRDAAAGRQLPQVDADGSAARERVSKNGQIPINRIPGFKRDVWLYQVGFDASWEIDLWGHQSRSVQAATARAEVARDAHRATQVQVVAEVVRCYVDLRSAQEQLQSVESDAKAQESIAALVNDRYQKGESSRFDFVRADAQARTTRAAVPALEAAARAAAYELAVLTGQPPETLVPRLLVPATVPQSPATVSAGLRSDLLRRRPDILQAERQLAAATADVGVATADLFPRVSLLGSVGQQAQNGGDLLTGASNQFTVGPSLHWPIFAGGALRANIRAANARADAAATTYESAVLSALSDSETAINRFAAAQRTQRDRDVARRQSEESVTLARERYRAGEDDLIVLLQAQSAFTAAEQQSIAARAATSSAMASLYKALGGGWEN